MRGPLVKPLIRSPDHPGPLQLLDELPQFGEGRTPQTTVKETSHWLLRFPSQCVLVAEAIAWERETFRSLETQDRENLSILRWEDVQIVIC